MVTTLDELRAAARAWVRIDEEHAKLIVAGPHEHERARAARERANGALRALVTAADLHAARGEEGLADLIRSGHSLDSAKRVRKLRSQAELERAGRAASKAIKQAGAALAELAPVMKRKPKAVIPTFGEMKRDTSKGGRHALDRMAGKPRTVAAKTKRRKGSR